MFDYESRKELNKRFLKHHHDYLMGEMIRRILPTKELTGREIKEKWRQIVEKDEARAVFYTHIPYCLKKCSFCMYYSEELKNQNAISDYIEALTKRYDYYADVFSGRVFSSLYFGGGTPNILSDKDIEKLLTSLYNNYSFSESGEKTFEGNPVFATPSKLKLLHDFGINRVSFGVQSFDGSTLQRNNRAVQNFALIERAVKSAQDAGIEIVNLDLIMGFAEETVDGFIESFKKALMMDASTVSVYPIQQTSNYLNTFFDGHSDKFMDYRRDFINRAIPRIDQTAKTLGYHFNNLDEIFSLPGEGNCVNFTNKNRKTYETDEIYFLNNPMSPTMAFSNGTRSISKSSMSDFYCLCRELKDNPEDDVYDAVMADEREAMTSFLLNSFASERRMKLYRFKEIFNKDVVDVFGEELKVLVAEGRVTMTGDEMILDAEEPKQRTDICLMFLDDNDLKRAIGPEEDDEKNDGGYAKKARVIKDEYLTHTEETYKKMSSKVSAAPVYIFDGAIDDISANGTEAMLTSCVNGEIKRVKLSDQLMVVEQYILAEGDEGDKNIWREMDLEELFSEEDKYLSYFIEEGTDKVLVIRKIIPMYC